MANIVVTVATNVGKYLAEPIIREVQYFLCVNNVIDDLENEREELTRERDNLLIRVAQAKERTEVIEKPVEKWLSDVENLIREVEVLVQRTENENNCFQGWLPTCGRYLLCKQMVEKIVAMGKFKGKSKDIQPFSHRAPLPGIQYQSSKGFINFESTKVAYSQLLETLENDSISIIGVYGIGGCGKTTLVTEVGKEAEKLDMFDKVISITVSRTPNIRGIQGEIADMLNLKLEEESDKGRAQRLWLCLKEKRILIIVDDLWREFHLMNIGILLDNENERPWKILITTRDEQVCTSTECQIKIHLGILSEDESWILFQKIAQVDDEYSNLLDGVPRKICNECKGLPLTIKTVGSSLKGSNEIEWQQAFDKLKNSEAFNDGEEMMTSLSCLKLSYDLLPKREAQLLLMICSLFPEDYHIPTEDLMRYAFGLGMGERLSLQAMRSSIHANINKLLDAFLVMHGSVKMHDLVRDAALWIANRSDNNKILVNVDKLLSIVSKDNKIGDCFALSSWWYNVNPSFCPLHAPNLKILILNINAHGSLTSLDLSPLSFEGIQGLEVFSLTINYKKVSLSFPPSIQLLTNVRTLRLNGLILDDISFIGSLTSVEVLDLQQCRLKELPNEIGKCQSLKLLDLSECNIFGNNYNGVIGKCSQLEEFYASTCYPLDYVRNIILDIGILPNLQRFVIGNPVNGESTRVVQAYDFNISELRTSNKNILQIAETISLSSLCGGYKNIIPDVVGAVGRMNDLTYLRLEWCKEIECIFDATYDFKEDDLIPRLVKLHLHFLFNLTELCRGPPLQLLRYFEKLELLDINCCWKLHIVFPWECKLRNLKILSMRNCKTDEVLFSASVGQSMQQLEQLKIHGCPQLKYIISASGSEHAGCNTRLTHLQNMNIEDCPKLEYVFHDYDQEHLSSHQYHNHIMLPLLESLTFSNLTNLIGIYPEYCREKFPSQFLRILRISFCPNLATPWFSLKAGNDESQHSLNENTPSKLQQLTLYEIPQLNSVSRIGPAPRQSWSFQYLRHLTVGKCEELKCVFSMKTHRSLPELMDLDIYDCQELEQIVAAADEELMQLRNDELYFPKLKLIKVRNCNKLKSLFPIVMVRMLPRLRTLEITESTRLEEVFSHGPRDIIISETEVVLPNLTEMKFVGLPNFVDICHGCKLSAAKALELDIFRCPKYAPRHKIRMKLKEAESKYGTHPFDKVPRTDHYKSSLTRIKPRDAKSKDDKVVIPLTSTLNKMQQGGNVSKGATTDLVSINPKRMTSRPKQPEDDVRSQQLSSTDEWKLP